MQKQADKIATSLKGASIKTDSDREIIALIAYLQRLGSDIKPKTTPVPAAGPALSSN
jgi:cytochrome c oxidase cbb3-type subunit I/II